MVFRSAELLQNFMPDRVPRLSDAMEKLFGGAAGWRWELFPRIMLHAQSRIRVTIDRILT